jgi:hypothetical protein
MGMAARRMLRSAGANGTVGGQPDPNPWTPGAQPTNSNVGLPGVGNPALSPNGSTYISTSNITYTNISRVGNLTLAGSNVTLIGCKVVGELIVRGNDFIAEDSDIGALSLSGAKRVRASRVRTTGVVGKDGVHVTSDVGRCEDIVLEDSYIGNPMLTDGSHYDSIQVRGVDRLTLRGNYFDQGTIFDSSYNATVFLEDAQGGNYDIDIHNNWLRAAGYYNVRLYGYNQTLDNNVFIKRDPTESDGSPNAGPVIGNSYVYMASGNTWDGGTPLPLP